jgi:hypothetical protein
VETRIIDGRSYLMIQIDDQVEVNGVTIRSLKESAAGDVAEDF